jgi:AcrR family transcriptional regulator
MTELSVPTNRAAGPCAVQGRRERNKQRTRDRIIAVALELCERQGFDETTVEQIADAADVSKRTVNRYFATKEDIILGHIDDFIVESVKTLRGMPVDGDELGALVTCYLALLNRIATDDEPITFERFLQVQRVLRDSPAVSARSRELDELKTHALSDTIAQRLGVCAEDLSVRLIMGTWSVLVHIAMDCENSTPEQCAMNMTDAFATFREVCTVRANADTLPGRHVVGGS